MQRAGQRTKVSSAVVAKVSEVARAYGAVWQPPPDGLAIT